MVFARTAYSSEHLPYGADKLPGLYSLQDDADIIDRSTKDHLGAPLEIVQMGAREGTSLGGSVEILQREPACQRRKPRAHYYSGGRPKMMHGETSRFAPKCLQKEEA